MYKAQARVVDNLNQRECKNSQEPWTDDFHVIITQEVGPCSLV